MIFSINSDKKLPKVGQYFPIINRYILHPYAPWSASLAWTDPAHVLHDQLALHELTLFMCSMIS